MEFSAAIRQMIRYADSTTTTEYAVKRPSWKGYIYCSKITHQDTSTDPATTVEDGYNYIFKYANGYEVTFPMTDALTTDDILFKAGSSETDVPTITKADGSAATVFKDYVPLTTFLLNAIVNGDDWECGDKAAYEQIMSSTNEF